MKFSAYEDIVQLTAYWEGERSPDGRPKVSDDLLNRLRKLTLEEAWGTLYKEKEYLFQFQGGFRTSNRQHDKILVGRAVTTTFVPLRPDLNTILMDYGMKEEGRHGAKMNQWVIDSLVEDDVVVVDLFDKVLKGTYIGGNLATAIQTRTKRGGAVIWGGVRDLEQIEKIDDIQVYFRGNDPTGIREVTMVGFNGPCRIGNATCLPGDIVLGTLSGVLFIPPHLVEDCVVGAEKTHVKDIFGFERLDEGTYTTANIDNPWTPEIWLDFMNWLKTDRKAVPYAHLSWEAEMEEARKAY